MKPSLGSFIDRGTAASIDLARLLETRMLIQANSGQGKSRALRRLLEQTAGLVQQIIIDPEGEFASLREKHDLVICAAQGGDVVAHPRTAALLARKLRETQVSAVLDLSELKAHERHAFMHRFLEALVECPRALWNPCLVAIDECQVFAPEKGQGESEASAAVIDVATRGRKRGLCLIAATLRISMLHKAVAAELKNRLIGGTVQDLDVKRLAFDLGMTPKDALAVLRDLEPGHFLAYGPALDLKAPRELVTGEVRTTHPEVGKRGPVAPPKPTAAIVAMLPKLADLPKEAETEARTIEDLKRELSSARRELAAAAKQRPAASAPEKVGAGELRAARATIKRLREAVGALMKIVVRINAIEFGKEAGVDPQAVQKAIDSAVAQAMRLVDQKLGDRAKALEALQRDGGRIVASIQRLLSEKIELDLEVKHQESFSVKAAETPRARPAPATRMNGHSEPTGDLSPVQQRILNALAEAEQLSAEAPDRSLVAILSGYTHIQSTGFVKALGALSTSGLISYPPGGRVALTDAGRDVASMPDVPTTAQELQERVCTLIGGAASKVLKPLIEANGEPMSRQDLATAANYGHIQSTGFVKVLGKLRTLGFIDYPSSGMVVAQPVLFLEASR